jgi:hypothetical protein
MGCGADTFAFIFGAVFLDNLKGPVVITLGFIRERPHFLKLVKSLGD